jgi:hypothetical protein
METRMHLIQAQARTSTTPIDGFIERMGTMSSRLVLKSLFIALPAALTMANGALAADRPTNPAAWPALKSLP